MEAHPAFAEKDTFYYKVVTEALPLIWKEIFAEEVPYANIGFHDAGGVSGYYSSNMVKADRELVELFAEKDDFSLLNTRVFKTGEAEYVVTVASVDKRPPRVVEWEGPPAARITIEYGEFAGYLGGVVESLKEAKKYARSDV